MERVIDRREYRRSAEKENIIEDEEISVIQNKIKKLLFQTLGVSIILLIISFLKHYNCLDILNKIESELNKEITISSLQKSGQRIYEFASDYYIQLDGFIKKVLNNDVEKNFSVNEKNDTTNIVNNKSGENVIYIDENIIGSGDSNVVYNVYLNNISGDNNSPQMTENHIQYQSAVEGVNQMSDDAKYIKENYELTVPVIGTITSEFGVRNSTNPIVSSYHSGLDIAANTGTQILAVSDGEVIEAKTDTYYGKYLKIKKDDIIMTYAHCSKLLVKVGDKVKKGKLIAYVGNTGNSTGPHLHLEIKYQDRLVNPKDVLEF